MRHTERVEEHLCRHAEIDRGAMDRELGRKVRQLATNIVLSGIFQDHKRDQRPDILQAELLELRKLLAKTAREISKLDTWAASVARRLEEGRWIEEVAAGRNPMAIQLATVRCGKPRNEWLDIATIDHLNRLEKALKVPIETLVRRGSGLSKGPGAKPDLVARRIALTGAQSLVELTGQPLTAYRCEKLAADLFRVFGIDAKTRRVCEWVMSELAKKTQFRHLDSRRTSSHLSVTGSQPKVMR